MIFGVDFQVGNYGVIWRFVKMFWNDFRHLLYSSVYCWSFPNRTGVPMTMAMA